MSCGKNDDDGITPNPDVVEIPAEVPTTAILLPKSDTNEFDTGIENGQYEFDGNKLMSITWDDVDQSRETYTYQDGKLINTFFYWGDELVVKKTFAYNGDKLASLTAMDYDAEIEELTEYTYNTDSTVSIKEYGRLVDEDNEPMELSSTGVLTLSNGNVTKFVRTSIEGTVMNTYTYTFDDKHSPFSNVFANDISILAELEGGVNNYTGYTVSGDQDMDVTIANFYNEQGYLIKATQTTSGISTNSTFKYY